MDSSNSPINQPQSGDPDKNSEGSYSEFDRSQDYDNQDQVSFYKSDDKSVANESVAWTASEFIAHQKNATWYLVSSVIFIAITIAVYIFTKDFISAGIVLVAGLILEVYANHKPRVLDYKLDNSGLKVGEKFYPYYGFKSFSVINEGAFASIQFLPLRRFMPPISIYCDPNDEQKIIDLLADFLPIEQKAPDIFDSIVRRIRF